MATASLDAPSGGRRLLAPVWHTAGLVGICLASYAFGAWLQRRAGPGPGLVSEHRGVVGIYLTAIALDAALFSYVFAFTSLSGTRLSELIGGQWRSARDVLIDLAIAGPFWVVWQWAALLVHRILGPSEAKSIGVLLPVSPVEMAVWILVSLTAGFCEEVVFRGYLQKQLLLLTGSAGIAVAGQAVCFGLGHGYQGWKNAVVITVLGALYGVLAQARRSTRPGMIAHAWSDIYGGLRMDFLSRLPLS